MRPTATLSFAIFLTISTPAFTQNTSQPVYLNHIFFVLDSNSYAHVFDSAIIQKLGYPMTSKTTTAKESWFGKYLMGKDSYFEIFGPGGYAGSSVGSFGFGFMTTTSGDIVHLEAQWKAKYKDSVKRDTSVTVRNGTQLPWFYQRSLYTVDSSKSGSVWVMEHTPEMLKSAGFTDDEMKKPILWNDYMEKRSKMKYAKSFMRIVSAEFVTNKKELGYFRKSFLGIGLTERYHTFYNDNIHIIYTVADIPTSQLKSAEIELADDYNEQTILFSDRLFMHINGKKAILLFAH